MAGGRLLGCQRSLEQVGETAQGLAFQGSSLGESSRGLVQENGPHQRTRSVFLHP